MLISIILNGKKITEDVRPDLPLLDFVRKHGCKSVKCGCETSGCGLCTVFLDETPILSCSLPAVRADKKRVTTLEGLQEEAAEFGAFLADEGAEQCGFCNPGMIMNVIAMLRENPDPTDEEVKAFLAGNLCRCSGYEGQMRAIRAYLAWRKRNAERMDTTLADTDEADMAAGKTAGTCCADKASEIFSATPDEGSETARGTYREDFAKGLRYVGKPVRKKDAMQLVTGKPVFAEDIMPDDFLVVKLKRSPHANAMIRSIDKKAAMAVPGVEAIFTWEDVDQDGKRYTQAGQTWPEPSPYDRLVLDRHVRFAGDVAAIVVADTEKNAEKALKLLKIEYDVLPAVMDYHTAKDNETLVHPEANWESLANVGADNKRNLCAHAECGEGDIEGVLKDCDIVIDEVYHTKAVQQTMMETFRTWASIDPYGRLDIVSSTQIVFHARRIIANALHIPKSQVRVRKPRIGGGFGAKQTAVSEVYPAFVTWMLKKPSRLIFTREETQTASSPRHEMEMHVRLGAMKDGTIRGIDLYTISNTGAYGEHGPTTVGLSGHKSIPLYGSCEAFRFVDDVVYTNHMSAGAYRGYGATQGIFAVETAVNELAAKLSMDPIKLRLQNIVHEGERMMGYYGETATSCHLEQCVEKVREMIGWDEYYPRRVMPDGKIRSVGIGMSMQGSGISSVDVGSATLRLQDDGTYTLRIAAADMGTGCDTTLSQIAAEVLECDLDDITVYGGDTDTSPYDSGSYASSTAYVTGKAVERCAWKLREKICEMGARKLGVTPAEAAFDGKEVYVTGQKADGAVSDTKSAAATTDPCRISLQAVAAASQVFSNLALEVSESNSSKTSPPPFMAGAALLETDPGTGETKVLKFCGCVDCGTPLNPNLTRVQTEGGVLQGIGMALTEDINYNAEGRPRENSLMQYHIPARTDVGEIEIAFDPSYEELGPYGAKSIGEVVINSSAPAIVGAVMNATGKVFRELPVTPEKIAMK